MNIGISAAGNSYAAPLNLFINIFGALFLGFVSVITMWKFDADIKPGLTIGLLGAFTTFPALFVKRATDAKRPLFHAIFHMTISVAMGCRSMFWRCFR